MRTYTLALAIVLGGCSAATETETHYVVLPSSAGEPAAEGDLTDSTDPDATESEPDRIGTAVMEDDGTIVLRLRAEGPDGVVGTGVLRYEREDPDYAYVLAHVGSLAPGDEVGVRPFPGSD